MALCTAHVLVRPSQGKRSPQLVIEKRWFPLAGVVAIDAVRNLPLRKLLAMDVAVAVFALRGRFLEVNIGQLGFQVGWLVAVHASRRPVSACKRKCGLRVIESR